VNVGGKHTLFNALVATVDKGDEVIIPAPYWVSYPDIVAFTGGNAGDHSRQARTRTTRSTPAQLEAAITPKTKWLIVEFAVEPVGRRL
jgi:aspartate aminotransferase